MREKALAQLGSDSSSEELHSWSVCVGGLGSQRETLQAVFFTEGSWQEQFGLEERIYAT